MKSTTQPVTARVEKMTIPTYPAQSPDPNPMFFETRNIQGAKGNIYPQPFTDQISVKKVDRKYDAVILENEFIQMVMLPELGGRIFAGLDKTNGYDFFYRHSVIKPALIGLCGPWISGGVEFNWPQHHRPSTFVPTNFTIEEAPDGSKTVWMGEHDPLNRTKGMVGICLYPGKAYVETKVRLYNRTPFPQTFLWWENAAVKINERYQVIFPPDVHYAVYHTKAFVIEYPIGKGHYVGNDYGDGTDISWYVNSPRATSFFAAESKYEFFGGYDFSKDAGVVHVADGAISGGKKYFTWANGPAGHQWQKNLYDYEEEGEYLELMAGAYTDNQPDFSWIMPYETKTFSQFWYPVQKIGAMKNGNLKAAVNLEVKDGKAFLGAYGIEVFDNCRVILEKDGNTLLEKTVDLGPGKPMTAEVDLPDGTKETDLIVKVLDQNGSELIRYQVEGPWDGWMPEPFTPPASPSAIKTNEELFLAGLHLEQYRHTRIDPEPYWEEALRRDEGDARCNIALGKSCLKRGLFAQAEKHFRKAVNRLIWLNFNPYDGEAHYQLGLTLFYEGKLDEAVKAYNKAIWSYAWQSAGYYGLAQIDMRRRDISKTLEHLDRSLSVNTQSLKARNLKAAALRYSGKAEEAEVLAEATVQIDPLDFWARNEFFLAAVAQGKKAEAQSRLDEMKHLLQDDVQVYLDIAFDYIEAGLYTEAADLLSIPCGFKNLYPMIAYVMGYSLKLAGKVDEAKAWYSKGASASPNYCFPWRLGEMAVLQDVILQNPDDVRACYYLGNLLYDKKRRAEAVNLWLETTRREPSFAIPWRNLGLAAYNYEKDIDKALLCFEKATSAAPDDPRLFLENDFLLRRKGISPEERLARYERRLDLIEKRDDLNMELMMLYNRTGQPEKAIEIVNRRLFHPWEGGEGSVSGQYANACWLLGRSAQQKGNIQEAISYFKMGLTHHKNLGEVQHDPETVLIRYDLGMAYLAAGEKENARQSFDEIMKIDMDNGLVNYCQGLALIQLGKAEEGHQKLVELKKKSLELAETGIEPNFFYYGNPSPTFEEDQTKRQRIFHTFIAGMACMGLEDVPGARSALGQVLAADPSNLIAYEELKRLG